MYRFSILLLSFRSITHSNNLTFIHTLYIVSLFQVDNALIIWQQPHIIWMGELSRRAANATGGPSAALAEVQRLSPLVLASADYLAARMYFNESDGANGRYWLGPPVEG